MRITTLLALLLSSLLFSMTVSHPTRYLHRGNPKLNARNFEEELGLAAEDAVELWDTPRIHDSSEVVHHQTEKHNITADRILETIKRRRRLRQQQLRVMNTVRLRQNHEFKSSYSNAGEETGMSGRSREFQSYSSHSGQESSMYQRESVQPYPVTAA